MPDRTPEQHEHPPQWPPPSWHSEPTVKPKRPGDSAGATGESTNDHQVGSLITGEDGATGSASSFSIEPEQTAPADAGPTTTTYRATGDAAAAEPVAEPVVEPQPPAPPPSSTPAGPPPTHGRGIRMAIYGAGGAVIIGLLVAIVVMAGGTIVPNLGGDPDDADDGYALLDDDGHVDPQVYAKLAAKVGTNDWIDWRYGAAAKTSNDAPKAKAPKTAKADYGDKLDHRYQAGDGRSTKNPRNIQGQLGFVPNSSAKNSVDHVTTSEATDSTFGFTPRPGGRFSSDTGEIDLAEGSTAKCLGDSSVGHLVDMDRSSGDGGSELATQSVSAFSSGAIATTGTSGAQGGTCAQLPDGQVPTSITVTPANEFALVTVWDTKKTEGKVAVIALASQPKVFGSSWPKTYPGLPNPGYFGFAKLLGFVPLKSKAPTTIAASTESQESATFDRSQCELTSSAAKDECLNDAATKGFAVVGSKAEKTLERIDLSPLLSEFTGTYKHDSKAFSKPGDGAKQWPQTFAANKKSMPKLAASTKLNAEPTAVTMVGSKTYLADSVGEMTTYRKTKKLGSVKLPGTASSLTMTADGKQVLAVSREDRSISWVSPKQSGATIDRTLRDSRITDPIAVQDSDPLQPDGQGTEAHTVCVADYGSGSLLSYRYGSGRMAAGDPLSLADKKYLFGGAYKPDGKPFAISTTADTITDLPQSGQ